MYPLASQSRVACGLRGGGARMLDCWWKRPARSPSTPVVSIAACSSRRHGRRWEYVERKRCALGICGSRVFVLCVGMLFFFLDRKTALIVRHGPMEILAIFCAEKVDQPKKTTQQFFPFCKIQSLNSQGGGQKKVVKKSNGRPKGVRTPLFCLLKNGRHARSETCLLSTLSFTPKQTKELAVDSFETPSRLFYDFLLPFESPETAGGPERAKLPVAERGTRADFTRLLPRRRPNEEKRQQEEIAIAIAHRSKVTGSILGGASRCALLSCRSFAVPRSDKSLPYQGRVLHSLCEVGLSLVPR